MWSFLAKTWQKNAPNYHFTWRPWAFKTSTFGITWCDHFWPKVQLKVAEGFHIWWRMLAAYNCMALERQQNLPRANFCLAAFRCLSGSSGERSGPWLGFTNWLVGDLWIFNRPHVRLGQIPSEELQNESFPNVSNLRPEFSPEFFSEVSGKFKWGLKATLCNLGTIAHNCAHLWPFGPLSKGGTFAKTNDNCRRSWTIVDKYVKPPFAKPPFRLSRIFWGFFVLCLCRRKQRPQKIHPKIPPFFNAKFPGKYKKKFTIFFWRAGKVMFGMMNEVGRFPEGPGIEKIRSRPSRLKISSDRSGIEIFDRALLCTPGVPRK